MQANSDRQASVLKLHIYGKFSKRPGILRGAFIRGRRLLNFFLSRGRLLEGRLNEGGRLLEDLPYISTYKTRMTMKCGTDIP